MEPAVSHDRIPIIHRGGGLAIKALVYRMRRQNALSL